MANPQQQELRRSEKATPTAPSAIVAELSDEKGGLPADEQSPTPVPPDNRPGAQSGPVQDKPDMARFVERFSRPARQRFEAARDTDWFSAGHAAVVRLSGGTKLGVSADEVTIDHGPWHLTVDPGNIKTAVAIDVPAYRRVAPHVWRSTLWLAATAKGVAIDLHEPVTGAEPSGRVRVSRIVLGVDDAMEAQKTFADHLG